MSSLQTRGRGRNLKWTEAAGHVGGRLGFLVQNPASEKIIKKTHRSTMFLALHCIPLTLLPSPNDLVSQDISEPDEWEPF